MSAEPRILLIDIETSPILGYTWGMYDQTLLKLIEPSKIICAAWKWFGKGPIHVRGLPDYRGYRPGIKNINDKALVRELWELLNKADVVIAHNGDSFDIKKMNARFIAHKFGLPSDYKTIDTKKVAKKTFRFDSNKLDLIGDYLGEGRKESTGGFELWDNCIDGDLSAWAKMRSYNRRDVALLEKVYIRLRPFISNHPNLNILAKREGYNCPACQSSRVYARGKAITKTGIYTRWQCQDCGSWSSSKFMRSKKVELR